MTEDCSRERGYSSESYKEGLGIRAGGGKSLPSWTYSYFQSAIGRRKGCNSNSLGALFTSLFSVTAEVRGLWHFLLRHIMKCNDNSQAIGWCSQLLASVDVLPRFDRRSHMLLCCCYASLVHNHNSLCQLLQPLVQPQ